MPRLITVLAALGAVGSMAEAQTYSFQDRTPPGSLEAFFLGAGGQYGVGYRSSQDLDAPFPDARSIQAMVWDQVNQTTIDLDPLGQFSGSFALGAGGAQQVGYAFTSGDNFAMLWSGSAASAVRLDTAGTIQTIARGTDGFSQVGYAITPESNGDARAMVWNGTAESGRELSTPVGFNSSAAEVIRGGRIVGVGEDENYFQAGVYWADADAEAIVVRPDGFEETRLNDVDGDWVLGSGYGTPTDFQRHAFLWDINNISAGKDLHPGEGYSFSEATALIAANSQFANGVQVGIVAFENDNFEFIEHAAVWFGSAGSFIDLHSYVVETLGESFRWSTATGVDEFGNVYGTAHDGAGNFRSVQWVVPAPSTGGALLLAGLLAARRRRG